VPFAFQSVKRMFVCLLVSKPEVKYFKTGLPKLRHLQIESCRVFKRVTWERRNIEFQKVKNSSEGRERIRSRQDTL
jgi:single-stranded DNA-binding protein